MSEMNKYFSNIELYYSSSKNIFNEKIIIDGDEFLHIAKVMRHKMNEEIYSTDGEGNIFKGTISKIEKDYLEFSIIEKFKYQNKLKNIFFCIPKLKNSDRFEFALEKSVELGITNFIIFESGRTISKSKKIERWNKIMISAMKQSLRSFLPKIELNNLKDISDFEGNKFIFEQKSERYFAKSLVNLNEKNYFIFGPEGGFTLDELNLFDGNDFYNLAENRLRSETAILKCASFLYD